ncbi:MAG: NADH:ubiquinone oxidoreductase [Chloroflexi bacterium RBG_19FT_COMBO_55_16]|nr:MAG: NADH:ubiquinone oxidoreductase [Chloroflexi bacterium RBG_19FT_COMBO_55_16]
MSQNGKPKVAFFDFTCCEGCQLTVIDSLQDHPDLLAAVEIVQFREAMSEKGEDYLVAFIEGSCSRESDEARLKKIREQASIVVALGACAHLGGVNSLKYLHPLDEVRQYVYGDQADWYDTYDVRPIEAVIPVDFVIPGCPIDRQEFISAVKSLLVGKKPFIPDYPLCVECKLKENTCLFTRGKVCMGPVTRAGCDAICPTYGQSCEACRGFISNPNDNAMREVLTKHGLTVEGLTSMYTMFTTYQVRETLLQRKNANE